MAHFTGTKYEISMDVAEIAKRIRADIKAAIKAGTIPAIKTAVRTKRYSGGQSINIDIKSWDGPVKDEAAIVESWQCKPYTPALKATRTVLEDIMNAYNMDRSDSQSDYFHCHFYGHVNVREWEIAQAAA